MRDDEYEAARNNLEREREKGWTKDHNDRQELDELVGEAYDDFAADAEMDEWDRTGKSTAERELDDHPEGSTSRDIAEAWYDVQADALAKENDGDRLKAIKKRDKQLGVTHGITTEQAVDQALAIDKGLRERPAETLAYLQDRFRPEAVASAAAGASQRSVQAIDQFMRSQGHDRINPRLSGEIIRKMNTILQSGQYRRTGDFQRDLKNVHDLALTGIQGDLHSRRGR